MNEELAKPGDHLRVRRGTVWHHGILAHDNIVIEFTKRYGPPVVRKSLFAEFAQNATVYRVYHEASLAVEEVIGRAHRRLGSTDYCLFNNNCEHFANYCKIGKAISLQADLAKDVIVYALQALAQIASKLAEEQQRIESLKKSQASPTPSSAVSKKRQVAQLDAP